MCQILGMNCASPTDFSFSLKGFCRRGGDTDIHSHGWGAAIYEGKGIRCFHDTQPACRSPIAQFMLCQTNPIRTLNMMAHIRYATAGEVALENVHPFTRELWGVPLSFCHNGECPRFCSKKNSLPLLGNTQPRDVMYRPIGDTDSEAVFCAILNALRVEFPVEMPDLPALYHAMSRLCHQISYMEEQKDTDNKTPTIFNFLLGFGPHTLFAYSWPGRRPGSKVWNGLHYIIREPPFSTAQLIDDSDNGFIDFRTVTKPDDRIAVITTKPLTSEQGWTEIPKGKLVVLEYGVPYWSAAELEKRNQRTNQRNTLQLPASSQLVLVPPCENHTMAISDGEEENCRGDGMEAMSTSLESQVSFLG